MNSSSGLLEVRQLRSLVTRREWNELGSRSKLCRVVKEKELSERSEPTSL